MPTAKWQPKKNGVQIHWKGKMNVFDVLENSTRSYDNEIVKIKPNKLNRYLRILGRRLQK